MRETEITLTLRVTGPARDRAALQARLRRDAALGRSFAGAIDSMTMTRAVFTVEFDPFRLPQRHACLPVLARMWPRLSFLGQHCLSPPWGVSERDYVFWRAGQRVWKCAWRPLFTWVDWRLAGHLRARSQVCLYEASPVSRALAHCRGQRTWVWRIAAQDPEWGAWRCVRDATGQTRLAVEPQRRLAVIMRGFSLWLCSGVEGDGAVARCSPVLRSDLEQDYPELADVLREQEPAPSPPSATLSLDLWEDVAIPF